MMPTYKRLRKHADRLGAERQASAIGQSPQEDIHQDVRHCMGMPSPDGDDSEPIVGMVRLDCGRQSPRTVCGRAEELGDILRS